MSTSKSYVHTLLALALASAALQTQVAAQDASSTSVNPLPDGTLSPTIFSPSQTFTPITTFPRATNGVETVLTGVGPTADPGSVLFTYTVPTASVSPLPVPALSSSLASEGYATATDARNLAPNPDNLQFPDSAVRTSATSLFALLISMALGAVAVLAL